MDTPRKGMPGVIEHLCHVPFLKQLGKHGDRNTGVDLRVKLEEGKKAKIENINWSALCEPLPWSNCS